MDDSLRKLTIEVDAGLKGLDAEGTQLRPKARPDAWTIQQIVEHLLLTYDGTIGALETRLEKGSPTKKPATVMQRASQALVVSCGYFPGGRSAPDAVQPKADSAPRTGDELNALTQEKLAALSAVATKCEQQFGKGRCATHFLLGPMSVAQWCRFHVVHGHHHLKQIAAIRNEYEV